MSTISDIFTAYKTALQGSRESYENLYTERSLNTATFYENFFNRLIIPFKELFEDPNQRRMITRRMIRFFEQDTLDFIAIDGTCIKKPFADFITFYGGAYGAKGQLILTEDPPKIRYKKWSLNKDVSMVAWVPVPFAQLSDVTDSRHVEDFAISEQEKVNLAGIHTLVMQLAEIFLAFNTAASSEMEYPRIILMDQSPSSVLASVSVSIDKIGLAGYPYDRRKLDLADIMVASAHPFNDLLNVPSSKRFLRHRSVIAALAGFHGGPVSEGELGSKLGITIPDVQKEVRILEKYGVVKPGGASGARIEVAVDLEASWNFTVALFQNICRRLFLKKDPTALQYDVEDEYGMKRRRWMAPDDLKFLISVGLRALIEKCWEKKIMLYGIIKDSESRYLTRHYLGVAQETGYYPELNEKEVPPLPWTDRIFMENIPLIDDAIESPWSTIEFDSAFMTLHKKREASGSTKVAGVMGRIVNQERFFMRSLAQFFLSRDKATPLMGHIVFLDRLCFPEWELPNDDALKVKTDELGKIRPLTFRDRDAKNIGQLIMVYLLSVLTKNHFSEVMGYPDPLHKADWGAKTIGRRVASAMESSAISFKSKPISRTFRMIRDSFKR